MEIQQEVSKNIRHRHDIAIQNTTTGRHKILKCKNPVGNG
jgi:hypothetical protein